MRSELKPYPAEIKPCPYINGFTAYNDDVSFVVQNYEAYFDFILFADGKPDRCFRFTRTPDTSAVEMVRELMEAIKKNKNVIDDVCRWAGSFENMGVHQEYQYARTVAADTLTKAQQWLKQQGA